MEPSDRPTSRQQQSSQGKYKTRDTPNHHQELKTTMPSRRKGKNNTRDEKEEITASTIPLSHPDRSPPTNQQKTLLQLVEERSSQLGSQSKSSISTSPSKEISLEEARRRRNDIEKTERFIQRIQDRDEEKNRRKGEESMLVFEQSLFLTASLTMLHFTLDVLVHHQYAQEMEWMMIAKRAGVGFPILLLLLILTNTYIPSSSPHSPSFSATPYPSHRQRLFQPSHHNSMKQRLHNIIFFTLSTLVGIHLIHAANREPYLAVMKRAPPLGTLWIWAVLEMDLGWALTSLGVVGGWCWWGGYSIF